MSAGRNVLKVLWSEGLRVYRRADGTLALIPPESVTPDLLQLARNAKPAIEAVVRSLPSPNCCAVCGSPVDADGKAETHCVDCGLLAAERLGLTHPTASQLSSSDISTQEVA